MEFLSDTTAPVHPKVLEALSLANQGHAASYGEDALTKDAEAELSALFETDVKVWFTVSGTASNALALSVMCPSYKAVLCHREAHIQCDERGAPEFFTGGAKLSLLDGENGRMHADALKRRRAQEHPDHVHETPAATLSISNLTECGTVYTVEQVGELSALAHAHGLNVHMDGARLANALVHTGASAADMTWRAGVDVLSFGATKNGAMSCEAIILFGEARALHEELLIRAKRAGHMPPKQRFIAAQMLAMLRDDLWRDLAGTANAGAAKLAHLFTKLDGAELRHPVQGNEVFVELPDGVAEALASAGVRFHTWPFGGYRFVCSWNNDIAEADRIADILKA